ncbi:MAG TPA: isocitrate/isopropylmalate family dehydrogenase, partial [Pelobium sp.]|nr:isocitrate/isopropylmalate family dehydrogenase [Pelobium sp.]
MKSYKIAAVNGDGIGHEIVPMAVEVMQVAAQKFGFQIHTTAYPYGAGYYLKHGDFLAPNALEELKGYDAILFGAVGLPEVDDRLP